IGRSREPSAGFSTCCVWFDSAVGTKSRIDDIGVVAVTCSRGSTAKRGIGFVNGLAPTSGLGGSAVASSAYTLFTNGLSPPIGAKRPAAVKSPIFTRSRLEIRPHESSRTISARLRLACSASLCRAFECLPVKYITLIWEHSRQNASRAERPTHSRRLRAQWPLHVRDIENDGGFTTRRRAQAVGALLGRGTLRVLRPRHGGLQATANLSTPGLAAVPCWLQW